MEVEAPVELVEPGEEDQPELKIMAEQEALEGRVVPEPLVAELYILKLLTYIIMEQ